MPWKTTYSTGFGCGWLVLAALSGCSLYAPLPLQQEPTLAGSLEELQRRESSPIRLLADPAKPVNETELVKLVLVFNPELRSVRLDRDVVNGQVVEAGLLPNPQVGGTYEFLLGGPATFDALAASLQEDLRALIIRGAQLAIARYAARQVDAALLWQEWQTIGKVRLLYVDLIEQQQLATLAQDNLKLLTGLSEHIRQATQQGNIDLAAAAPNLAALADATKQANDVTMQLQSKWQELDALLGLAPSVRFDLAPLPSLPADDSMLVENALTRLPKRPDLLALELGYQSQEQKLRAAVLGQFPALQFGGAFDRDTSNVRSFGPTVTMDLPIFNHNQGNVAIEQATRQKLHAAYTAQLNAAVGDLQAMNANQAVLRRQLAIKQESMSGFEQAAAAGEKAYALRDIDERVYVDLETALINQRQQVLVLEQGLYEQDVAMAALTGRGMPQVNAVEAGAK